MLPWPYGVVEKCFITIDFMIWAVIYKQVDHMIETKS